VQIIKRFRKAIKSATSILRLNVAKELTFVCTFCIVSVGVRCRHKKFTFAISSPDEFLVIFSFYLFFRF